jgi:hypothetical protein
VTDGKTLGSSDGKTLDSSDGKTIDSSDDCSVCFALGQKNKLQNIWQQNDETSGIDLRNLGCEELNADNKAKSQYCILQ